LTARKWYLDKPGRCILMGRKERLYLSPRAPKKRRRCGDQVRPLRVTLSFSSVSDF